jgi:predicted small metal-binding protein
LSCPNLSPIFQPFSTVALEMIQQTVLQCDCGFEVRAEDEVELVAKVQRHSLDAHGMHFSPDEVLQLALRAESGERSWQQQPGHEPPT